MADKLTLRLSYRKRTCQVEDLSKLKKSPPAGHSRACKCDSTDICNQSWPCSGISVHLDLRGRDRQSLPRLSRVLLNWKNSRLELEFQREEREREREREREERGKRKGKRREGIQVKDGRN